MPILLCPGCWISLLFLFLLWLLLWSFARIFKFKWAIKVNDWCIGRMKAIYDAVKKGKEEEKECPCDKCGCDKLEE
jgi:hypothetical protein